MPRRPKPPPAPAGSTHVLVRAVYLRALGAVLAVAFVSLWVQLEGLIGPQGLAPLSDTLARTQQIVASHGLTGVAWIDQVLALPTLSWLLPTSWSGTLLSAAGLLASVLVIAGRWQGPALLVAFACYLSLSSDTQRFLGFQWDTLLTEVTFASLLVAPWSRTVSSRAPQAGWWLLRWNLFRLVFFGGLVKLTSGDPTWWDGSALTFHYETQPLPNPVAWYAHQLPYPLHALSVLLTFGVELVLPFGFFGPRKARLTAGAGTVGLMALLAATGNYGFFQLLTVVLCLTLLTDAEMNKVTPGTWAIRTPPPPPRWAEGVAGTVAALLVLLSLLGLPSRYLGAEVPPPVRTVLTTAAPWRIVNHYGLFARMTTERPIPVLEGRWADGDWTELTWRWQTSDPAASPPWVAPHMPRIDWMVWFAGLGGCARHPWLPVLQRRLAEGSEPVSDLIGDFRLKGAPPTEVRTVLYRYRFTAAGSPAAAAGQWYTRERVGVFCPPERAR